MIKKLMRNTAAAAGFAAFLLVGACASTNNTGEATQDNDDLVHVSQSDAAVPAAGPALIDSDGNVYTSSAAPGSGNAATLGTNTNVNIVPEQSSVRVSETSNLTTNTTVETTPTTTVVTTPAPTTTITTTTTTVPMTSSSAVETQETTTRTTATRTRLRKD